MLYKSHIKLVQSLRHNKFRKQLNLFIAEGPKVVDELLNSQFNLHLLFATRDFFNSGKKQVPPEKCIEVTSKELERLSLLKTANEVLGIFEMVEHSKIAPTEIRDLTLVLDEIHDPGNMGTIIRTADWFGIDQIICSEQCVDVFNPKVVQSTMGSLGRVHVLYLNLFEFLSKVPNTIPVYGADMNGTPVFEIDLKQQAILVIGSESHGISDEINNLINHKISIPTFKSKRVQQPESLNASVATAILCTEFRRKYK